MIKPEEIIPQSEIDENESGSYRLTHDRFMELTDDPRSWEVSSKQLLTNNPGVWFSTDNDIRSGDRIIHWWRHDGNMDGIIPVEEFFNKRRSLMRNAGET